MDSKVNGRPAETSAHLRLKHMTFFWAQAQGYSVCATEVSLPQCRYRADVAAYRPDGDEIGVTAIFECKQALPDLRRDNCCVAAVRERLETVHRRRQVLEKHLRVHYPALRVADSLFQEFESHNFTAIEHQGYARVLRELSALQNRLFDCSKFDDLARYRCANLLFLVLPNELFREPEIPFGWGALVAKDGALSLARKPVWHESPPERRVRFLQRIATAGTRNKNRELGITFEDIISARSRLY